MHEYATFAVTLLVILAGILLNRNDTKDLRAEIGSLRSEVNSKLTKIQDDLNSFHRSLGTARGTVGKIVHDARAISATTQILK